MTYCSDYNQVDRNQHKMWPTAELGHDTKE